MTQITLQTGDLSVAPEQQTQATPPVDQTQQTSTDEGKLFAGKYKTVEELEAGYLEAQKTMSSRDPSADPQTIPPSAEQATEQLSKAGVDMDALDSEYRSNGKLSDESYAKLEKAGFSRARVDNYIRGWEGERNDFRQAVYGASGGEETYGQMLQWAQSALSKDEIEAFNGAIDSGKTGIAKLAVQGLYSRFTQERGAPPAKTLSGKGGGNTSGVQPFKSTAELSQAMADRRYANDPAYRSEVQSRLAVSTIFG